MSEVQGTQQVPAGWYPDHTGEPRMRWWDGQQWTDHVSELAPNGVVPGQVIPRNTVPSTTPLGNPFIWIIVLLPLVSAGLLLSIDWRGLAATTFSGGAAGSLAMYSNPLFLITQLFSWVLIIATVVLGYFDWRKLGRDGVPRPFFWAWAFLGAVYVIGRSVVVWRRAHRGLAPLWVYIAVTIVGFAIGIYVESQFISAILQNVPSYSSYTNS